MVLTCSDAETPSSGPSRSAWPSFGPAETSDGSKIHGVRLTWPRGCTPPVLARGVAPPVRQTAVAPVQWCTALAQLVHVLHRAAHRVSRWQRLVHIQAAPHAMALLGIHPCTQPRPWPAATA